MSAFDRMYRSILLSKFFVKGWGHPDNLKRLFIFRKILSNRETCQDLVASDYPIHIQKEEKKKDYIKIEGYFTSPFIHHVPDIMPKEVETAKFQMYIPLKWRGENKPVCIQLAGTGDHGYGRRARIARPLLKEAGIASIILENPYYGCRKPRDQLRSRLHYVSDLFVMGGALVLESLALLHWCERQGFGPLGITGISMGGFMASLAATNWHKPISLVPCLSASTASVVYTQGVIKSALPWKLLHEQYESDPLYEEEVMKHIVSPEWNRTNDAFNLGKEFARYYQEIENSNVSHRVSASEIRKLHRKNKATKKQSHSLFHTSSDQYNNNTDETVVQSKNTRKRKYVLETLSTFLEITGIRKEVKDYEQDTMQFMTGVMDECTHLGNFSVPVDPSLIIIVQAKDDAYVPQGNVMKLEDLWPGSEVRYVNTGHIQAFLTKQDVFRKAISDSLKRQAEKYYS